MKTKTELTKLQKLINFVGSNRLFSVEGQYPIRKYDGRRSFNQFIMVNVSKSTVANGETYHINLLENFEADAEGLDNLGDFFKDLAEAKRRGG